VFSFVAYEKPVPHVGLWLCLMGCGIFMLKKNGSVYRRLTAVPLSCSIDWECENRDSESKLMLGCLRVFSVSVFLLIVGVVFVVFVLMFLV